MIRVFYDGKCGLCRREIAYYQRIAPHGVFEWIDITRQPDTFTALGYSISDGLKALHVQPAAGEMRIGVDAFMAIWQELPRWRLLARCLKFRVLYRLAVLVYDRFAAWRFTKLGYGRCEL